MKKNNNTFNFRKYHGTGNDFVVFPANELPDMEDELRRIVFSRWCHRRFGIGADGVIIVGKGKEDLDFEMIYFNADGRKASFCGNGSRCAVQFAKKTGLVAGDSCRFHFGEDTYEAKIEKETISVKMKNIEQFHFNQRGMVLDTGSPHLVIDMKGDELSEEELRKEAVYWRESPEFAPGGTNVNFVSRGVGEGTFYLHTYERGVEDFTFSCGTGAVATAAYLAVKHNISGEIGLETKGGKLVVTLGQKTKSGFENIWLSGPAVEVFRGSVGYESESSNFDSAANSSL